MPFVWILSSVGLAHAASLTLIRNLFAPWPLTWKEAAAPAFALTAEPAIFATFFWRRP